jgi:hypothetical protein
MHLTSKGKHRLKVKGRVKVFQANGASKQAFVFISEKADIKSKLVKRDKEGHFILIKGILHQEGIIYCKHTCIECQHIQFHETNSTRHKSTTP